MSSSVPELKRDPDGLALVCDGMVLRGDFTHMLKRVSMRNLRTELLVRAAKLKGVSSPTAVDATAGLGEDALLLAAAGFTVRLYEYNAVIAALLRDALKCAALLPELAEIAGRMELTEGDSTELLPLLSPAPDIVFLDPMFPARQKNSLIKKKLQLLQKLEAPCVDEEKLFYAAVEARPRKVVIKRPLKGEYLAGVKPDYSIEGKTVRYDCVIIKGR